MKCGQSLHVILFVMQLASLCMMPPLALAKVRSVSRMCGAVPQADSVFVAYDGDSLTLHRFGVEGNFQLVTKFRVGRAEPWLSRTGCRIYLDRPDLRLPKRGGSKNPLRARRLRFVDLSATMPTVAKGRGSKFRVQSMSLPTDATNTQVQREFDADREAVVGDPWRRVDLATILPSDVVEFASFGAGSGIALIDDVVPGDLLIITQSPIICWDGCEGLAPVPCALYWPRNREFANLFEPDRRIVPARGTNRDHDFDAMGRWLRPECGPIQFTRNAAHYAVDASFHITARGAVAHNTDTVLVCAVGGKCSRLRSAFVGWLGGELIAGSMELPLLP